MTIKVGIPRALLYYEFERLWQNFYQRLGAEVVISGPTNKRIVDQGAGFVVDEACLPVKVFFGHALQLAEKVDYLFVPRIISIEPKTYICPKVIGLPDMLAASRAQLPPLIMPNYEIVSARLAGDFIIEAGRVITSDKSRIKKAWQEANQLQAEHQLRLVKEFTYPQAGDGITILVIGHSYLLFDDFLNMNLLKKLQAMGCKVVLSHHLLPKWKGLSLKHLPKQIFWSYGRDLLGAVYCFSEFPGRIGAILLTSFGCGIDSIIGNMILRHLQKKGIPHLNLTVDEHTGEAGLNTRIEAFTDMMHWRRADNEDYLSAYGQYLGSLKGAAGICRS